MELAKRLKQLRLEKGLSTREVSKELGLGVSTISNYENEIRRPDVEMLARLADYYNCTTDYLLGKTNTPNSVVVTELPKELKDAGVNFLVLAKEFAKYKFSEEEIKIILATTDAYRKANPRG